MKWAEFRGLSEKEKFKKFNGRGRYISDLLNDKGDSKFLSSTFYEGWRKWSNYQFRLKLLKKR